jgi:UDP-N-acetylmuramyl tripeptide synthase
MKIRAVFAILLCRLLRGLSRLLHRGGTAMPGRWALKVCPDLLQILAKDLKILAVTGTNGKTTSARMIEEAFTREGLSFVANRSGANLASGLVTELVMNATLTGKSRKEYAILECDEAAARTVFCRIKPRVIVVTNLFRDQLDRYGEVTHTLENIRAGIQGAPEAVLCLNADCSLTASLALDLPNPVRWFGVEQGAVPSRPLPEISDATHCIRCKAAYEYDYVSYGHLGGFRCPKCGYRRHKADVAVTSVVEQRLDGSSIVLEAEGEKKLVEVNLPAMYNIYNAVGAAAAVTAMGLPLQAAIDALGSFHCGFGRMEQFPLGKAGTKMMLVKNPAGCNQVIEFLQNVKEDFVLAVCLNDRDADGKDISWIWDADFEGLEALSGRLKQVLVSGDRAQDMRVRIKYAGIPDDRIRVERDYGRLVDWAAEQTLPVFLMPTYTAMLELRQTVVHKVGGREFWEN